MDDQILFESEQGFLLCDHDNKNFWMRQKKIVDLQDFPENNKFSFFSGFVLPPRLTIRSELLVWAAIEMDVRLL